MNITIQPQKLSGTLAAPPSKSVSHRAVICAALADGESEVRGVLLSEDIHATIDAMTALGAAIEIIPGETPNRYTLMINGTAEPSAHNQTIDCRESGLILYAICGYMSIVSFHNRLNLGQTTLEIKRRRETTMDCNCSANRSIACTVTQCRHHCDSENFCSLDHIQIGTHEADPTVKQCTDCMSFDRK